MTAPKPEGFTAGPWRVQNNGVGRAIFGPDDWNLCTCDGSEMGERSIETDCANAARIVYAHNTIDTAIAERDLNHRLYVEMSDHASALKAQADSLRAERDAAITRADRLEVALRELAKACEAEFCGDITEEIEPDDSKVSYPEDACHITFGHIRRALAALSAAKVGGAG